MYRALVTAANYLRQHGLPTDGLRRLAHGTINEVWRTAEHVLRPLEPSSALATLRRVPRAFLFDLDGTLVDRTPSLRVFLPGQLARYGDSAEEEEVAAFVRRFLELDANGYGSKEHLYGILREEFGLRASVAELIQDFRANAYRRAFLFPDAAAVLGELRKRGHRLAIVSNGSAEAQGAKIAATGLAARVDVVLISGVLGLRKPDPAIFREAARLLGVDPGACVFVGDDPEKDVAGAARAGMRTAWVAHGRAWPEGLEPAPDHELVGLGGLRTTSW